MEKPIKFCIYLLILVVVLPHTAQSLLFKLLAMEQEEAVNQTVLATQDVDMEIFETLKDRMSIHEMLAHQIGNPEVELPPLDVELINDTKEQTTLLCNASKGYKASILDAITKSMNFYRENINDLGLPDNALALTILNAISSKHGGTFQTNYPLAAYVDQICGSFSKELDKASCHAFATTGAAVAQRRSVWYHHELIHEVSAKYFDSSLGNDKETAWIVLNSACMDALLVRCEVPYVCERVMFDSVPRSKYHVTHQLLHRKFAETLDCLGSKYLNRYHSPDINLELCSKIYAEANLLAKLGDSVELSHFSDLFAEQVGLCAYAGFPNFLRADWLDKILSRQTMYESGCFVTRGMTRFLGNDKPILIKPSKEEINKGIAAPVDEVCKPHLTAVSLVALTAFWDYIEETC